MTNNPSTRGKSELVRTTVWVLLDCLGVVALGFFADCLGEVALPVPDGVLIMLNTDPPWVLDCLGAVVWPGPEGVLIRLKTELSLTAFSPPTIGLVWLFVTSVTLVFFAFFFLVGSTVVGCAVGCAVVGWAVVGSAVVGNAVGRAVTELDVGRAFVSDFLLFAVSGAFAVVGFTLATVERPGVAVHEGAPKGPTTGAVCVAAGCAVSGTFVLAGFAGTNVLAFGAFGTVAFEMMAEISKMVKPPTGDGKNWLAG